MSTKEETIAMDMVSLTTLTLTTPSNHMFLTEAPPRTPGILKYQ